jgi:hypothetical protein
MYLQMEKLLVEPALRLRPNRLINTDAQVRPPHGSYFLCAGYLQR